MTNPNRELHLPLSMGHALLICHNPYYLLINSTFLLCSFTLFMWPLCMFEFVTSNLGIPSYEAKRKIQIIIGKVSGYKWAAGTWIPKLNIFFFFFLPLWKECIHKCIAARLDKEPKELLTWQGWFPNVICCLDIWAEGMYYELLPLKCLPQLSLIKSCREISRGAK